MFSKIDSSLVCAVCHYESVIIFCGGLYVKLWYSSQDYSVTTIEHHNCVASVKLHSVMSLQDSLKLNS